MSDLINQNVGRYQIKELIGEGAMAKVYRVYDPEIDRSLALKILKSDLSIDGEYLSRFLREAKAAGALSHSNIMTVFDVGEYNKSPYILMELLEGGDLGDLLAKKRTVSVRDTLVIALQLAKALNYAHEAGVVHRDIKPDNVMILEDGVSVKIADFGIARFNESEDAQKTQIGSVLGTPRYMSPEQALGQSVDGRSDLYSVGVILYEMLTGEKAFDAANIGTLMTQIIQQQPTSLKQAHPELPSGLCQIVQKLLHKKPEKRFQTGAELAAAISKELNVYNEQEASKDKNNFVPLKVRWSLYMATIVAFVMLVSITIVFNIQSNAMAKQAIDSGTSFAKFIAIETAVPLLSEDWITLETFIDEASGRNTFSYLIVTDRQGVVRGASDKGLVGKPYAAPVAPNVIEEIDGVVTTERNVYRDEVVFNIEAPVLFQDVNVGKIVLGLSQSGLNAVMNVTGWLMFALAVVTLLSVSLVLYIFGGLITQPLKLLNSTVKQVAEGDLDARVSVHRNDEIGELINNFNHMVGAMHKIVNREELEITSPEAKADAKASDSNEKDSQVALTDKQTSTKSTASKAAASKKSTSTRAPKASSSQKNERTDSKDDADKTIIARPANTNDSDKTIIAKPANTNDSDKTIIAAPKKTAARQAKGANTQAKSNTASRKRRTKSDITTDSDKTIISMPDESNKNTGE